jgi:hypothetical protein
VRAEEVQEAMLNNAWEQLRTQGAVTTEVFAADSMDGLGVDNLGAAVSPTGVELEPEPEVMWYTASLHAAEVAVANALTAILGAPTEAPPAIDDTIMKEIISELLSEGQLQLSAEQHRAVEAAVAPGSRGAIVTGGPGCKNSSHLNICSFVAFI